MQPVTRQHIAHHMGKVIALYHHLPKRRDLVKAVASRVSKTEMIIGLVISGLMVVIACVVMHILPQIAHAKLLF